jgi:D-serine deaminase-like pyridoxal phosphate-dependent protein
MIRITKPTLIINKEKCLSNLAGINEKARKSGVVFRPHFKTHQSAIIGNWFRKEGIREITVSTISMAKYFFNYGWKDITVSLPVNVLETYDINELANNIRLNITVESVDPLKYLDTYLTYKVGVYIKIDTGYHRSGILWDDQSEVDVVLNHIARSRKFDFIGFMTHAGQTYKAETRDEIIEIYNDTVGKMNYLKKQYIADWPNLMVSIGDTPSCSIVDDYSEVDEVRPGNFIFYDLMQYSIGACNLDQISIALAAPVIAKSSSRSEIVIYGGAVHLSKEFLYKSSGDRIYGYVVLFEENGWSKPLKGTYLARVTQDHGIIKTTHDIFEKIQRSDIIGILPIHSCLTANLMKRYITLDGENIDY